MDHIILWDNKNRIESHMYYVDIIYRILQVRTGISDGTHISHSGQGWYTGVGTPFYSGQGWYICRRTLLIFRSGLVHRGQHTHLTFRSRLYIGRHTHLTFRSGLVHRGRHTHLTFRSGLYIGQHTHLTLRSGLVHQGLHTHLTFRPGLYIWYARISHSGQGWYIGPHTHLTFSSGLYIKTLFLTVFFCCSSFIFFFFRL